MSLPSSRYVRNSIFLQYRTQRPGGWLIQATPQLELSLLGTDLYTARIPFALTVQQSVGRERFGLLTSFAKIAPASSEFGYLNGTSWSFRAYWLRQGRSWVGGPNFTVSRENASSVTLGSGSVPLGYTGYGPGVSGFWVPSPRWEFNGTASYQWRSYLDPAQPGDIQRSDRLVGLNARFTHRNTAQFAPYLEFDATVNASTLDATTAEDRNYSRFVVLTGLSWDLL